MSKGYQWPTLFYGDEVAVIAPSGTFKRGSLSFIRKTLARRGLKARIPKNVLGKDVFCANPDSIRLKHLKWALADKKIKVIWAIRGGWGGARLLPDLAKLKRPRQSKLLIGYSDITSLHAFLQKKWNWQTLHAPMLESVGRGRVDKNQVEELFQLLFASEYFLSHMRLKPMNAPARQRRQVSGRLIGGNLTVFTSLLGTPYFYCPKGSLLVFEDLGERGYRLDRMFTQLQQAGVFDLVSGMILGDFSSGDEPNGKNYVKQALELWAKKLSIPVYSGLEIGHANNQRPLPLNRRATVSKAGKSIHLNVQVIKA